MSSVLLMAKLLQWDPPLYLMKNVTGLDREKQEQREAAAAAAQRPVQ